MKKRKYFFTDRDTLISLIDAYFAQAEDALKTKDRKTEPPTVSGLALFIGFNSKEDFDAYESKGKFASIIKRARFRVTAYYETRLHYPSPTGAMFALKSMGWHEKPKAIKPADKVRAIKIKIIESGPQPASTEKEVAL